MRVLQVHNAYQQRGGEEAVLEQEASTLRAHGEDVHTLVVSNDDIGSLPSRAAAFLQVGYNAKARVEMVERLHRLRPDVVHVHNFFPRLSPSVFDACMEAGAPSVMTLHNFRILCPTGTLHHRGRTEERSLRGPCWWTVGARAYRGSLMGTLAVAAMVERHKRAGTWRDKVGRFIALSPFARDKFVEGGLPAERIVVKPNAVAAREAGDGSARRGALFVGRLTEDKGVRVLLEAWRGLDAPLTLVGDGPLRAWAEAAAPPHVQVLGRRSPEEVAARMRGAALLVAPSLWHEMLPMTVLEAFASGLPVLASDTPSLRGLLHQGGLEAGELFPIGDAAALAAATRALLADPDRLARQSETGRRLYLDRYTPEADHARLKDVYEGVIAEGPRQLRSGRRGASRRAAPISARRAVAAL